MYDSIQFILVSMLETELLPLTFVTERCLGKFAYYTKH
jgi:hypothetical protein